MGLDEYIKEHIKEYMKYHLDRGYSLKSLKKALVTFGYTTKEIDEIAKNIKTEPKKHEKYTDKELKGETYYYIRGLLSDYIKKQIKHGFDLKDVREALIKYGHNRFIVQDAIDFMKNKHSITIHHGFMKWVSIFCILAFIALMSLMWDVGFKVAFLVLSPALFTTVLAEYLLPYIRKKEVVPIISILVTIGLFMFIFPTLEHTQADAAVLLGLNAVIAFFFTMLYSALYKKK